MIKKHLEHYGISFNLLMLLLILSPAFTDFYSSNGKPFVFLSFILVATIYLFEYMFNKAGYKREDKGKKIYFYIMPFNLIIFTMAVLFLFDY